MLTPIITLLDSGASDENGCAFDNALGALQKIVYFQSDNDDKGLQLTSRYLSLLPPKYDLEEGEIINKTFLRSLVENHPLMNNPQILNHAKEAIKRINEFRKNEEEILDHEGLALMIEVVHSLGI